MHSIFSDELGIPGRNVMANDTIFESSKSTTPAHVRVEFRSRLTAVPDGVDTVMFAVAFDRDESLMKTARADGPFRGTTRGLVRVMYSP
jgi:hypothetical protein